MDSFIIPNVEFSTSQIPSRAFFRGTKKISLEISDTGITFAGKTLLWTDVTNVKVEFFNSNPYISLSAGEGEVFNFFFENKFYYRKKAPWFGASEFITTEFVKALEEKGLFTVQKLQAHVNENMDGPFIHTLWNVSFFVFPIVLILLSAVILYVGITQNAQIQLLT